MADEAPPPPPLPLPPPPAVVAPRIERIRYGNDELSSAEVIQEIDERVSLNQQIDLLLVFSGGGRFDATGAMQNTIVENSRHIKKIAISNYCKEKGEHIRCFTFCTRIVRGLIGKGKHLSYSSFAYEFEFELEQANQLAQAFRRLNNNDNDAIESFKFRVGNLTPVTFQTLLDALLATGVRKLVFWSDDNDMFRDITYRNINVDFTRMETNISLEESNLSEFYMRKEDCRNLFHSIKKNKGVEKLTLDYENYKELPEEMKRLFEEMMCENITLLDCILHVSVPVSRRQQDRRQQGRIFELIKLNRMWKRYMMQREREKKTRTVVTRLEEGENNNNNNEEEERKKRLKMRLLLHLFKKKPAMRDTILFHLLREYPDDLIDTDHFRNNY